MTTPQAPIHILLAEDDDNDARITRRALRKGGLETRVTVARDGQEALDYLLGNAPFEAASRPDLVLLDINLPKINGMEVLRQAKSNDTLRAIPMLMLTTSARPSDVATAYAHGANGFVCKPLRFADFVEVLRDLNSYWQTVARVPPR